MKKHQSVQPRLPRTLTVGELADTRGGSLNAYFSKIVGEKQNDPEKK